MKPTKYIFVTGGVLSGLGKGVAAASIGNILKAKGFKVNIQKCDPYLNIDAGTLNPGEHGEVFVTKDGAETDLDLGHYERFLNKDLDKKSSLMMGYVYHNVLNSERKGEYLGKTVQIIPHVIQEIQRLIIQSGKGYDVHIVEIGGTVGDYEGLHFLEAIRQMKRRVGEENVLYTHLVYLPYLVTSEELKTKPAQNSVRNLKELGIQPDILLCRSDRSVSLPLLEKLSLFCDVDVEAIIPLKTVKNIYEIPFVLESYNLGNIILKKLNLPSKKSQFSSWLEFLEKTKKAKKQVKIGLIAKYLANKDTYKSVVEALKVAAWDLGANASISWIDSEKITKGGIKILEKENLDGILIPGGFGIRGIEGKILAAQYARENKIPYFGICLGMQILVIEFARHQAGLNQASSTEFDPQTSSPVIDLMIEQKEIQDKGGTMRLGIYPCVLDQNSLSFKNYQQKKIFERHRHRFEFNNRFKEILSKSGLIIAGLSPNRNLVEIVEVENHPFMVGVQFHPEFQSRPLSPHPLFKAFVSQAINYGHNPKKLRKDIPYHKTVDKQQSKAYTFKVK